MDEAMMYTDQSTKVFLLPGNVGENVCALKQTNRNCNRNQVNLNIEVDGGKELPLFGTMVKHLHNNRGLIIMDMDFLSEISVFVQH